MNNYYFNPNRQLKAGFCSIIVKKIDREWHQGQWICAAHLTGSDYESFDEFRVNVFDNDNTISVAGVTGMVFASIIMIGVIIFITYRRYRRKYGVNLRRTTRQTNVSYITGTDAISISSEHTNDEPIFRT